MEISTLIGVLLGLFAVGVGMILKGASLVSLVNPAAFLIIIVGTLATVFVGFPMEDIKNIPNLFKILFTQQKMMTAQEVAEQLSEWLNISRREGLLSLENSVAQVEDEFLRTGMGMVIDGQDAEFIRDVLSEKIAKMEERHREGALVFTQMGTYAPTLGVLGAVVGLIAALSNLNEVDKLGQLISAAFIATLLGIYTGYVLWHPCANKLKVKSRKEALIRTMMMEGILSIQAGENLNALKTKIGIFLPTSELKNLEETGNEKA